MMALRFYRLLCRRHVFDTFHQNTPYDIRVIVASLMLEMPDAAITLVSLAYAMSLC